MSSIIRPQTETEKDLTPGPDGESTGFVPLMEPGGKKLSPEETFTKILLQKEKEATKKGLPFARQIAREDFKDQIEQWESKWKKQGFVTEKRPEANDFDWAIYSDLKNFELVKEDERNDEVLTARYKVPVYLKVKIYKWKNDIRFKYRVMEDGMEAVQRALKK